MKYILLTLVLMIGLTACDAGMAPVPYTDPNVQRAAAEAYIENTKIAKEEARRQADATQQAVQAQIDLVNAYGTATAGAQAAIFAGATATAQIEAHNATQQAFAASVEQTRAAGTQAANATATAGIVTQAAIATEVAYEAKQRDQQFVASMVIRGIIIFYAFAFPLTGLILGALFYWDRRRRKEWEEARKDRTIFVLPNGQVITYDGQFTMLPLPEPARVNYSKVIDERIQEVRPVPRYRPAHPWNVTTSHILELIRLAIKATGPDGAEIPRYDKLGLTSDRWTKDTDNLVRSGLIEKVERKGTFLADDRYPTLADLERAIITRELSFEPLPHPSTVDGHWHATAQAETG